MHRIFLVTSLLVLLCAVATAAGPPAEPAASVGQQACTTCHSELAAQFKNSAHARLSNHELRGHTAGCESCHGGGARHIEAGDKSQIFGFKQAASADVNRHCLACHNDNVAHEWFGSEHALNGLGCADCHRVHQSRRPFVTATSAMPLRPMHADAPPPRASLIKPEPQLCLDCHKEKRAQMMFSSHHPVREGKMACSSCHQAHGSALKQLRTEERVSDLCLQCHTSKQGPFVFEHPPVTENCMTCHEPHGTVANALLRQNEPFLCLQCHEAHFHVGRSGVSTAGSTAVANSANPYGEKGWRTAFGTKCTECHSQVHGSDMPSQSVSGRGGALTR